jgi:hypothetical protein
MSEPSPSLDLFVELAHLTFDVGKANIAACDLRVVEIAHRSHDEREARKRNLLGHLREVAGAAKSLATALEEDRVGIAIQDDEPEPVATSLCDVSATDDEPEGNPS